MSVRVDFYILAQADHKAGWQFACRLVEKAYRRKEKIYIHCPDQTIAHQFDELLWTFNDISFVPHQLSGETSKYPSPILIGYGQNAVSSSMILLNLANEVPAFYSNHKRIMEIVYGDEATRTATRERFKYYRAQSCEMHSHQMDQY